MDRSKARQEVADVLAKLAREGDELNEDANDWMKEVIVHERLVMHKHVPCKKKWEGVHITVDILVAGGLFIVRDMPEDD